MRRLFLAVLLVAGCGDDGGPGGPSFPENHPRVYLGANKDRLKKAIADGAPEATRFVKMVDKWIADPVGADIYNFQEWYAALMGQLTDDPKYCKAAVASLDTFIKSEEDIIARGEAPVVVNDSYLQIGYTIGNVALTIDYCYSEVGSKRERWLKYANQAVWNVWNHETAEWGGKKIDWSGWSVDNPVNNYYYSFLRATMLLGLVAKGELPEADEWITRYRDDKILGQLVPTFERDLQGGGSREGTGYGVSMRNLFETFDLWKQTTGEDLSTKTAHTRASMLSMMHETVPTLDRTAPIGDHTRDSSAALFDYHRQYLVELMHLFPSDKATPYARQFLDDSTVPVMDQQFMYVYDFFYPVSTTEPKALDGNLNTAYWAPGIGNLYARSAWKKDASWIALVAGPFTESHAHQDQGSILFYKEEWLAYDPNTETGSGIRAENEAHNLVRITDGNGTIHQHDQTESKLLGLKQGDGYLYAAADLTPAYKDEAKVQKVQRELLYLGDILVVFDRLETSGDTNLLWQVAAPVAPSTSGNVATITGQKHALRVTNVIPGVAAANSHSFQDDDSDYRGGYRIDFPQAGGHKYYLTVMSVDGAAVEANADGSSGVQIVTAGGTHKVSFSMDAIGATFTPAGGSAITLGATVDKLAE